MSDTQRYKISYLTASVARIALYGRERQLMDWLELESTSTRLRTHLEEELAETRAALAELEAL